MDVVEREAANSGVERIVSATTTRVFMNARV
jgi:hypothetical protein